LVGVFLSHAINTALGRVSLMGQRGKSNDSKIAVWTPRESLCQTTRTRERPNSTNSPHTRTVLPPHTTVKRITRPDTSIPSKRWNMPIKPFSGRRKPIANLRRQRRKHKRVWARREQSAS
jgi:hypothetical protein